MGASCVRIKKIENVPLDVVGKTIKRIKLKKFIAAYEAAWVKKKPAAKKTASKKMTTKKKATKKKKVVARKKT